MYQVDLTGHRYGRLTVLRRTERRRNTTYWLCRCDCGTEKEIAHSDLRKPAGRATVSCGCYVRENNSRLNRTHGLSKTPEYGIWTAMKKRCHKPTARGYENYGARGIKVCDRWRDSFENFYVDMGSRPSPEHTVDRRDNDGDYTPENCYWATVEEQQNNTTRNVTLTHEGVTLTLMQWARVLGVSKHLIHSRYKRGWSAKRIITTPRNWSRSG